MTADRQLPLEPTVRIDPRTQVDRIPGHDAICECPCEWGYTGSERNSCACPVCVDGCGWPWCGWQDHIEQEDA